MRYFFSVLLVGMLGLTAIAAEIVTHEVKPGETLYGIARRYDITPRELSRYNRIESPDLLLPGTVLTVSRVYRVERGDTLYAIARLHGTSVDALRELNELESTRIVAGQRLRLPLTEAHLAEAQAERGVSREADASESSGDAPREDDREPDQGRGEESLVARSEQPRDEGADPEPPGDRRDVGERSETSEEVVPVALAVEDPISFAQGGAWPVAGIRTRLEGKLPGVLIRAERGAPVAAVSSGRVVYAGPHTTFGNVVFIQSTHGYIYVYGGQERTLVDVGEEVSAGDTVGTVGISPSENGAALYFSVWRNNAFVDPESAPRG